MPGILIIKFGALGDILMAAPLVRRISEFHAGESVFLLTSDDYRDVFAHWPGISVQALPRRGAGAMLRAACWIRRGRFRRIYDLQSNDRSALLCALSGVRERVGNHARYPYTIHPDRPWRGETHIQERWREVLASAGVEPGPLSPWLPVPDQDAAAMAAWLKDHGLVGATFAILHPGASPRHPEKRWPYFRELALALRTAGIEVVWAGGRDDAALVHELAHDAGIDACGAFTLPQLAALGRHARFAVTNDSAPMHVLACSGIPVFGLFGPTDWRRNHAVGHRDNVICANPETERFVPAPLAGLAVERVVARLRAAGLLAAGE